MLSAIKTRFVIWVWNHTPTCAEMSRLASESCERSLSFKEWWRMKLHFVICVWCERYYKHLKWLHLAAPHYHDHADELSARGLSSDAKQRMKLRLKESER